MPPRAFSTPRAIGMRMISICASPAITCWLTASFSRQTARLPKASKLHIAAKSHWRRSDLHSEAVPASLSYASPLYDRRRYHSFDRPDELPSQDVFGPVERAILSAAYRHIPDHGFSNRALSLGSLDAGYPDISAAILPEGVFSLVRWHLVTQRTILSTGEENRRVFSNAATANDANAPPLSADAVTRKAELLTWERLMGNKEVVHAWQEALAIMAQPSYLPASMRELALLVDEIWALAGDTAVDPSWYMKRASLSAIYTSSELFMTTDTTADFAATRDFLHRRFNEGRDLGGYISSARQWAGFTATSVVNLLRSKGAGI